MSLFHGHDTYFVTVDSQHRISGSSTNFTIDLKLPLNNFDTVCLHQLSFPRAYYDVNSNTNSFILTELGVDTRIQLDVGNYNAYSLASCLASKLTSLSPNGWVYKCTYPNYSNSNPNVPKFTFTVTGNSGQPSLTFGEVDLWSQCGFNPTSTNVFVGNTLTSKNVIVISYINRVFLKSDICSEANDTILMPILITSNYQSLAFVYYENLAIDVNSRKFTNKMDNCFRFTFYDNYGEIIDNNGVNTVFTLMFYKKDRSNELHYESLRVANLEKLSDMRDAIGDESDTGITGA